MADNRLSIKEKIGYGMGDAGCNIIFGAIMLFVNYFYTDIFGLAPALVGLWVKTSCFFDGLSATATFSEMTVAQTSLP